MPVKSVTVKTSKKEEFIDITSEAEKFAAEVNCREGVLTIFVPHTTAGITINESADPDVVLDILSALRQIVPENISYKHSEGNSPAHIKAMLTGSSVAVPVSNGKLLPGTWQGIFLCEYDGPRQRRITLIL